MGLISGGSNSERVSGFRKGVTRPSVAFPPYLRPAIPPDGSIISPVTICDWNQVFFYRYKFIGICLDLH